MNISRIRRWRLPLIVVSSLAAGCVVGGLLVFWLGVHIANEATNISAIARANIDLITLRRLRNGDVSGATRVLEIDLETNEIFLRANRTEGSDQTKQRIDALLDEVDSYRSKQ